MSQPVPTVDEVARAGAFVAACMREGKVVPVSITFESGATVPTDWAVIVVGMVETAWAKVQAGKAAAE